MSITNVTYDPNPPRAGQPVTITFETPQSMYPTPDVRLKVGRELETPLPVTRTKSNKWQITVTATTPTSGSITIVQGTMIKILSI